MATFFIACPRCNKYSQAKTGFFANKNIKCDCGYKINTKTDKLTNRVCSNCKNSVVFDQSLGDKAVCPVCSNKINTVQENSKAVKFPCKQCGIELSTLSYETVLSCPVCEFQNDVIAQSTLEMHKKTGLPSVIKYEGDNKTLLWKHPFEDFTFGSQLIVHESQEAIFFKDGQALDTFGAGRHALETQEIPLISNAFTTPLSNSGMFHSEVYFVNLALQSSVKWGTDTKVRLFDPISGLHLEIGASGEFNLQVKHGRKLLLKLLGTQSQLGQNIIGTDSNYFKSMIMANVKSYLAHTIKEFNINILEIDSHLLTLSNGLKDKLNKNLEDYGLEIPEFFVSRIITPDDDPNFIQMKQQFAQEYLTVREEQIKLKEAVAMGERQAIEAQNIANLQTIEAKGTAEALKIQKEAEAVAYKMQAEAEALEMQMKGYNYQQETTRQVGLEAMQNGIISQNGSGGGMGDIAGLGIAMGTMGGVMGMTREAMTPMANTGFGIGQDLVNPSPPNVPQPLQDGWNCSCGATGLVGLFCNNCGSKRQEPETTWLCTCGTSTTGKFCSNCGNQKELTWDCSCGAKDITGNFCSNCGNKKGGELS